MPKNDGGPAFPVDLVDVHTKSGMSLRDWFAGQALIGGLAQMAHPSIDMSYDIDTTKMATSCYAFADAMLAERAK